MKKVVKYDVDLDILLMVSISVIKYLFVRANPQIQKSRRLTVRPAYWLWKAVLPEAEAKFVNTTQW